MRKLTYIVVLIFIALLIIGYNLSTERFIPFLKYKSIGDWEPEETSLFTYYNNNQHFYLYANSPLVEKELVTWFGDTTVIKASQTDCFQLYKIIPETSDIYISTDSTIRPIKIGNSIIYIHQYAVSNPKETIKVDSFYLSIDDNDDGFNLKITDIDDK